MDIGWINHALIPGWLLFRRSFVMQSGLTPAIVHGGYHNWIDYRGSRPSRMFTGPILWAPIEIDTARVETSWVKAVTPTQMDDPKFWFELQSTNAIIWCEDGAAYATIAGTDTACILGRESLYREAFGSDLLSLDLAVREMVSDTLAQLESRQSHRIDDVWLREAAWLSTFR